VPDTGADPLRRCALLLYEHVIRQRGHVIFITWWVRRRMEEMATVLLYWAHPDCNTSGELGSFVVARELDQDSERFRSFFLQDDNRKSSNFAVS
jgi:hypothetical protein